MRIAVLPVLILLPLMMGFVAVGWLVARALVMALLPKFTATILAIQWNLLTWIPLSMNSFNNVFAMTGRMKLYTLAIFGGMIAYLICPLVMLGGRKHQVVFAQSIRVGRTVFLLLSLAGSGVLLAHGWGRDSGDR